MLRWRAGPALTAEQVVPFDLLMERLDPSYVLPDATGELYSITVEKDEEQAPAPQRS